MEGLPRVRITRVVDGDSLYARNSSGHYIVIRLSLIDAPEYYQPYGRESRDFLAELTLGKVLWFRYLETDYRYQRLVGILYDDPDGPSINRKMVAAGWAYYWPWYGSTDSLVAAAQLEARTRRRGMWAKGDTGVRPWIYREQQRSLATQPSRPSQGPKPDAPPPRTPVKPTIPAPVAPVRQRAAPRKVQSPLKRDPNDPGNRQEWLKALAVGGLIFLMSALAYCMG